VSPLFRRPQSARPLRVAQFIATRVRDAERGPQIRMNANEASVRMLVDGELVVIEGPRRQQLATLVVDDALPAGTSRSVTSRAFRRPRSCT
jgi:anaerobic selenocysteine-containing dehydrogenase